MCTVSMIGQGITQVWPQTYPWLMDAPPVIAPTAEEFEALRREVEELRTLLVAAKHFDEATGQPDCETDDKVALLRRIAEVVGVDLDDVLVVPRD